MRNRVKPFVMQSETPAVVHRRVEERPHVAMEVREGAKWGEAFGSVAAEEFVRHLTPWARESALGL
jgi:hypothetical protein